MNAGDSTRARPTVLLAGNRVVAHSLLARQRGIRIGTSLAAAHSIATDLLHLQRDVHAEQQRLSYLGQILYRYSSLVSLVSSPGGYLDTPDSLHHSVLLEVSASLTLFGGLERLCQQLNKQLHELDHEVLV
jgi:hypothetical protein